MTSKTKILSGLAILIITAAALGLSHYIKQESLKSADIARTDCPSCR